MPLEVSDLPGRAEVKAALHLLDRRGCPSSKEGQRRRLSMFFGNLPSRGYSAAFVQERHIQVFRLANGRR